MRGAFSMLSDALERLLPVLLVLAVVGGAVLAWRLLRHSREHAVDETLRDLAVATAALLIVAVTLLTPSFFADDSRVKLVPFVDVVRALSGNGSLRAAVFGVVGNVVLFVPFGMALRWRWPGLGVAGVVGCALVVSVSVEVMQALLGAGRVANSTDVITNTLGGLVGAALLGTRTTHAGAPPRS